MKCPQCQHENPQEAIFCNSCGARCELLCPCCARANPPGSRFCSQCGQPLEAAAAAAAATTFTSPQAYTPKHLAEKILTSRSALEGERKQVTVLFCDVVDSSRLAERLEPEAMHEVMNRALRLMAEAVHRYQGTVNQFLGDGLMALFGAPVALEDHAFRAVQAALAIHETLNGFSEQLKKERDVEIQLRLGLNTGLVVVGRIGDDLRMDYTAIGDTTHLAARMQALAEPGTTLITEATHRLVEGYFRSEVLGPVRIKGRSEPVTAFKVTGRRRARTRLDVRAERGLTQLVGRQRELHLLHECLARVKAGRGQVVGIVGDPGVGKSRLLYEFRKSLESERATWLEGHCVGYGQTTPYLPLLEILRASFQIEEGDNQLQIREKLRQGVRQLHPSLEDVLPYLQDLFNLPGADDALRHLDPRVKRQKVFETVRTLAKVGSERRPLVIIVEDLHWIDKTSEDYLAYVIESMAGMSHLLLMTHRPGYTVRWGDKTYYTQINLDLLADDETEAMIARLLKSPNYPADLGRLVREKAEGNPLFVEEITTSLLERKILVRRDAGIGWSGDAVIEFPGTVQDIIRARIDRLDDPVKRTVQAAAVIGRQFGLGLLERISEMAAQVVGYLDTLKHLELIHEMGFFPELEFTFNHAVTQDVAYQSLLGPRRKELHGAIARAIEDIYTNRLDEQLAILAYHYGRSERQDKAAKYALLAGDRAARLYANAEATSYYQHALDAFTHLTDTVDNRRARVEAAVKYVAVAWASEDPQRNLARLSQAEQLAKSLLSQKDVPGSDRILLARVHYWMGRIHYVQGASREAIGFYRQVLTVAQEFHDEELLAIPAAVMGQAMTVQGQFAKAAPLLESAIPLLEKQSQWTEWIRCSGFLGVSNAARGHYAEGVAYAEKASAKADELKHPTAIALSKIYLSFIHLLGGDFKQALEAADRILEVATQSGDRLLIYIGYGFQGWAHSRLGGHDAGKMSMALSKSAAHALGGRLLLAEWFAAAEAEIALRGGQIHDALSLAEHAVTIAHASGNLFGEGVAQCIWGQALSLLQPEAWGDADSHLAVSVETLTAGECVVELARTHVAWGQVKLTRRQSSAAREHFERAREVFEASGANAEALVVRRAIATLG